MNTGFPAPTGPVICGVDGSLYAQHAVDWAADEAVLRGTDLQLVHAWEPRAFEPHDWYGGLVRDAGIEALQHHAAQARIRRPDLRVTTDVVHAKAPDALEEASTRAGLLVVGRRGLGGFTGMLLGSVSRKIAGRSHCPLLVVPADDRGRTASAAEAASQAREERHPVVVGVADTSCDGALRAAFEEAACRRLPLVAFHAWSFPPMPTYGLHSAPVPRGQDVFAAAERAAEAALAGILAPFLAEYPQVDARAEVIHRPRVGALIAVSERAALTVIATHRNSHGHGRTIGSVTYAALHHAHSAVLLVPTDKPGEIR